MAWQENDPSNNKKGSDKNGPPELEELLRSFFSKPSSQKTPEGDDPSYTVPPRYLSLIFIILLFLYFISGFYIVTQPEHAVVTRLGRYYETKSAGLNWFPRFIDRVFLINMDEIGTFKKENLMLSSDENIVNVSVAIQYRKNDAENYLFADENPVGTLEQLAESSIRSVIGKTVLDEILTTGKFKITEDVTKIIAAGLNQYNLGLELIDVNLIFARPPSQVQQSFHDVTKAREDEQAYINAAKRYRDSQLPLAQGMAQRVRDDARAYKESVVLKAQGEASKFTQLAQSYVKSPDLLKDRLYYQSVEKILSRTSKILVDSSIQSPIFYLPFDKMGGAGLKNTQQGDLNSGFSASDDPYASLSNDDFSSSGDLSQPQSKVKFSAPLIASKGN